VDSDADLSDADSVGDTSSKNKLKQSILGLPSAMYIKSKLPGTKGVPAVWKKTPEHVRLYIKAQYEDFLAASSELIV